MTLEELRRAVAIRLAEIGRGLPADYRLTLIARHASDGDAHVVVTGDDNEQAAVDAIRSLLGDAALDAEQGKSALIMEAFWLAIADLPHADDCTGDVAYDDRPCNCWRSVANKALDVDETVKLCTQLRDREDELEAANARAKRADGLFRAADLELNDLKAKHRQALIELEDLRAESERFGLLTAILHEMYDSGSATYIDVLEEVKRRVALEATE